MSRHGTALVALMILVGWAARPVTAQTSNTSRSTGTGSASGLGSSSGATAGSASSLSSAQGYGLDSRFTGSGFNRYTTGSSAMGQTTAGAGAATAGAFGQSATGSSQSSRFGNLGSMGSMGGYGAMGGYGMGSMMGMRNMYGSGMQSTNQQQKGKVRTHMRLGFAPRATTASVGTVSTRFSGVVKRVLDREDVGGGQVTVSMEGSTAVLVGTVGSEHARDVLEHLAMLEPGIAAVRNELLVNPDVPTREIEPTSSTGGQPQ
jgi:hypothetical protein